MQPASSELLSADGEGSPNPIEHHHHVLVHPAVRRLHPMESGSAVAATQREEARGAVVRDAR